MRLKPTIKIALIYFAVGVFWIYLSDRLLFLFFSFRDESKHILFQNIKGFVYVTVTAFLLYKLIRVYYKKNEDRLAELESRQQELNSIQQLTLTGTWEYDYTGGGSYWSPMAAEIFEEQGRQSLFTDISLSAYIKEEHYRVLFESLIKKSKADNSVVDVEIPVVTAIGSEKWIRIVAKSEFHNGVCLKMFGTYQDITASRKSADRINQLNRLYNFLSETNRALVRKVDKKTLFGDICEIAIRVGRLRMAWIGLVDEDSLVIVPTASAGLVDGYLDNIKITIKDEPEGRGPTGSALRLGQYFVVNDVETDIRVKPWREEQLKRGYLSSVAIPILKFGRVIGAFTLYGSTKYFFNENELNLLIDATADISFALENMELESMRNVAEEKMSEALEKYDIVSSATSDTIWDWDVTTMKLNYNQGMTRVFGYTPAMIRPEHSWFLTKVHPNNMDNLRGILREVFRERKQVFQAEFRFRCTDGSYKFVHSRAYVRYNYAGRPVRVIGSMHDVTPEKELEQKVEKAIIHTQEKEREQIGMELHDNVNQILSASLNYIGIVRSDIQKLGQNDVAVVKSETLIRDAISEIRRLSHQLAPVSIKDISIREVFEFLADNINVGKKFKVTISVNPRASNMGDSYLKMTLYRILQEQLTNIVKYANATEVSIGLSLKTGSLVLKISDNGRGFDPTVRSGGIGLENIKRRANLFAGHFKLNTAPGRGCMVTVDIPAPEENAVA